MPTMRRLMRLPARLEAALDELAEHVNEHFQYELVVALTGSGDEFEAVWLTAEKPRKLARGVIAVLGRLAEQVAERDGEVRRLREEVKRWKSLATAVGADRTVLDKTAVLARFLATHDIASDAPAALTADREGRLLHPIDHAIAVVRWLADKLRPVTEPQPAEIGVAEDPTRWASRGAAGEHVISAAEYADLVAAARPTPEQQHDGDADPTVTYPSMVTGTRKSLVELCAAVTEITGRTATLWSPLPGHLVYLPGRDQTFLVVDGVLVEQVPDGPAAILCSMLIDEFGKRAAHPRRLPSRRGPREGRASCRVVVR